MPHPTQYMSFRRRRVCSVRQCMPNLGCGNNDNYFAQSNCHKCCGSYNVPYTKMSIVTLTCSRVDWLKLYSLMSLSCFTATRQRHLIMHATPHYACDISLCMRHLIMHETSHYACKWHIMSTTCTCHVQVSRQRKDWLSRCCFTHRDHVTSAPSLQTLRRRGWSRFCSAAAFLHNLLLATAVFLLTALQPSGLNTLSVNWPTNSMDMSNNGVVRWLERRSLANRLSLIYAWSTVDMWPLHGKSVRYGSTTRPTQPSIPTGSVNE